MPETPTRTRPDTPTRPDTSPIGDPERYYNPERLCPEQGKEGTWKSRP